MTRTHCDPSPGIFHDESRFRSKISKTGSDSNEGTILIRGGGRGESIKKILGFLFYTFIASDEYEGRSRGTVPS